MARTRGGRPASGHPAARPIARAAARPAAGTRARAGGPRAGTASVGEALARWLWLGPALWLVMFALLGADTFRIGFFADDFHLLDVARRMPLGDLLLGRYGIYPWYRPLSRELYFTVITHAGAFEHAVARLLSLAAVAVSTWQIRGIARSMGSPREGTVAMLLFFGYAATRFLAAWSSGFQDLLALALVLTAVREQVRGRTIAAVAWAVLATFAKETGVLAFPLLAAHALLIGEATARRRSWLEQAAGLGVAVLVHLAVRTTWHTGGSHQGEIVRSWRALATALAKVVQGFFPGAGGAEPLAVLFGVVATAIAALLLLQSSAAPAAEGTPAPRPALSAGAPRTASPSERSRRAWTVFLAMGIVLGLSPLVVGPALGIATAYAYYGFSAVPWLALLLARAIARLPAAVVTAAVPVLVGANTMTLGYRVPDLSTAGAWEFHDWDWPEALRLSAIAQRLTGDLQTLLANRPSDYAVLFLEMPQGCFFQSEDGPATRESLRDRSVRSYWLNTPPFGLEAGRFTVLSMDLQTWHLKKVEFALEERGKLAASSAAAGEAGAAWAYCLHGTPAENARFEFCYYRVLAALIAEGPIRARRELVAAGLADTTGTAPERGVELAIGPSGPLHAPMLEMLRHPLEARGHVAFADACRDQELRILEAVELRFATALDPGLLDARLRLAQSLLARGKPVAARRDLTELARRFPATDAGRAAAALLDSAGGAGKR